MNEITCHIGGSKITRAERVRRWLARIVLAGLLGLVGLGYLILSPNSWLNRSSAIKCTLTWGRLAPFPTSARRLDISTNGGPFTRAFRVTFVAPPEEIEQWLQQSPGTRDLQPSSPSPGIRHFQIDPGDGAEWAEVTVDNESQRVSIYVYWS